MRAPARLMLGEREVTLFPDGRVLVALPATALPFGCAMNATALYPSVRAFVCDAISSKYYRHRNHDTSQITNLPQV